jgi:acyl-coenzyme A synthetase/AMP-(fatty) acid ligase
VYTSWFLFADLSLRKLPSVPRKFCPVGKLLPGVHVLVMDDKLNVEPVGVMGEVRIEGPSRFWTICLIRDHTVRPCFSDFRASSPTQHLVAYRLRKAIF